jgi:hypothetical protein
MFQQGSSITEVEQKYICSLLPNMKMAMPQEAVLMKMYTTPPQSEETRSEPTPGKERMIKISVFWDVTAYSEVDGYQFLYEPDASIFRQP